jgi:hypothetical protein
MKKLLLFVLALLIVLPAISQVNFGIKAGLSTTSFSMNDIKSIPSTSASYTVEKAKGANYGFHGGIFFRFTISKFYLQPEVLLSTRKNEYNLTNDTTHITIGVKQNFTKLDVPIMLGVKFGPLRINAGPSFNFLINSPDELIKDTNYNAIYTTRSVGYQAGVGLDVLKKLTIDVRFEGSLKKYQNTIESSLGSVSLDDRPFALLVSLGYKFGK